LESSHFALRNVVYVFCLSLLCLKLQFFCIIYTCVYIYIRIYVQSENIKDMIYTSRIILDVIKGKKVTHEMFFNCQEEA
jgi:hypothetical protein